MKFNKEKRGWQMLSVIFLSASIGAIVYFLIGCLKSKFVWVDEECKEGMRGCLVVIFVFGCFLFSPSLFQYIGRLIPPESYEESKKVPLSPFLGGDGDTYAVIEKEDLVFLEKGKLVRRKYDEISEDVSFLPEDSKVQSQLVELKAKRNGFWKYFFIDPNKSQFFVPRSGIKKGEIKLVERYEFVAER